jgi:hypothetical protein
MMFKSLNKTYIVLEKGGKTMDFENIEIDKTEDEKVVHIEVNYPRNNKIDTIEIGMCEVRAADDIRIKYDFERDGWVILQSRSYHQIDENSYDYAEEWIESAFCPAWKYELSEEEKFNYKPTK